MLAFKGALLNVFVDAHKKGIRRLRFSEFIDVNFYQNDKITNQQRAKNNAPKAKKSNPNNYPKNGN